MHAFMRVPVCYLLSAVCKSAICFLLLGSCTDPTDSPFTITGRYPLDPNTLKEISANHYISSLTPGLSTVRKTFPRVTKRDIKR